MGSEVETILNEIRDRVRAERERTGVTITVSDDVSRDPAPVTAPANGNSPQNEALARVSAHLTTTARAWDRLPPVFSNRTGESARLELWIKARLKTLSRWFTWEQVNFNAAVHHALGETLAALSAHEKQLRAFRSELNREAESRRISFEKNERELQAVHDETEALVSESRRQAAKHSADLERQSAAAAVRARETKTALEEITERLAKLVETSEQLSKQSTEMAVRFSEQTADLNARLLQQGVDVEARLAEQTRVMDELSQEAREINARAAENSIRTEERLAEQAKAMAELSQEAREIDARAAQHSIQTNTRLSEQAAEVGTQLSTQALELNKHLSELAAEISSRLSGLATEISQVSNDLREEQRVCFKQLSLEASEAAVLEDRGRRALESRLEKLEKRKSGRQ